MDWLEALILGIIQGLTEFLPVSSSGHLELGKAILGVNPEQSLAFTVAVHGATVLSTIVVFRKDLITLVSESLSFRWNDSTKYIFKIFISMIPVMVLGLFFKDEVESFFDGRTVFVGLMLLVTAILLAITRFVKSNNRDISFLDSLIIGFAQALAVLPGISRSGATIATGLLLGDKREQVTRFSFLMVLIPIIGANMMDAMSGEMTSGSSTSFWVLVVGFMAAFLSGLLACRLMIGIVKKGNLIYFAAYCAIIGILAIIA